MTFLQALTTSTISVLVLYGLVIFVLLIRSLTWKHPNPKEIFLHKGATKLVLTAVTLSIALMTALLLIEVNYTSALAGGASVGFIVIVVFAITNKQKYSPLW